jgi:tRNA wybutosine-synthesizing protein 2
VFRGYAGERIVEVRHVERVKMYAPGVVHCVFDVWVGGVEGRS